MTIADRIHRHVQRLPEPEQEEVLAFVEYLLYVTERAEGEKEGQDWTALSLSLAMRGMEDEEAQEYTLNDLKETFY